MKYFKILEISYSDNLNITYCKELNTEEIKKEDGTTKTFTTYLKLGNVYSNEIFEEKTENLEKKNHSRNNKRSLARGSQRQERRSRAKNSKGIKRTRRIQEL